MYIVSLVHVCLVHVYVWMIYRYIVSLVHVCLVHVHVWMINEYIGIQLALYMYVQYMYMCMDLI